MQKTVYEDYKYSMQDTSRVYLGTQYTLKELLDSNAVPFKLQLIFQRYILPEAAGEDSLESHLYYLRADSFLVKIYSQLKARIKVSVLQEKKTLFGGEKKGYTTMTLTIEKLTAMTPEEKAAAGMVIQEFSVSKLAMLGM